MQIIEFSRNGKRIYGELYLPEGTGSFPVVIIGHGFGGSIADTRNYAQVFAGQGIASFAFDFIGGGPDSKSDGCMKEMSVLTEAADMEVILEEISKRPEIDEKNVFLMGLSQGGFVASYTAAKHPEKVRGLIAEYPAYVLQDDTHRRVPDPQEIPDTFSVMGYEIGKIYHEDAMSFDIYSVLPEFKRNVLLLHGTADEIVPVSYSERAALCFPSAKLVKIPGAGHGF
ncbi:MAG: alpha/beta hydrolase, partial [Lachnospiraceae bacterium]|nr:alpha/beta hydrolase [Lachnospiraceae bacterium]